MTMTLTPFGEAVLAYGDLLNHPERLPGYEEAVAAIARGEKPLPYQEAPATPHKRTHRRHRTVEEIRANLDRLHTLRDGIRPVLPDDPGTRTIPTALVSRVQAREDRSLARYARLSRQISGEEGRLALALTREDQEA